MQQFQCAAENRFQCPQCCCFCGILVIVQTRFYHLDVPVAEFFPYKVVYFLYGNTQFEFFHVIGHIFCHIVELTQDPFVCCCQFGQIHGSRNFCFFQVHHDETGSVPYFVCEVSAGFHTLPVETHIVTRCITGHQSKTQGVRAVFVDDFQRIDTVTQGFTHLSSLRISYQTVDQYMMERCFSGLFQSGEYHTDDPEENDIVSGYQYVGRIEVFHLFGVVRPAQCGEWPQCGGEPGIQGVFILMEMILSTFRADLRHLFCHYGLAAVVTVVSRDSVSPP